MSSAIFSAETYLVQLFWTLIPVWLFGALTGFLLPRPKFMNHWSSLILSGLGLRRAILAAQGVLILRELWYKITDVGTARKLGKSLMLWGCGRGWHFDFPSADRPGVPSGCQTTNTTAEDNWYVGEKDLAFFQYHGEGTGATQGASPWEILMEKEIPNCIKYQAWRRLLPNGKTEYKTISICADATSQEFMDLYLDDCSRPTWDTMITHHEVLEHGDFSKRQQVVRWIRKFPFSFITDREYIIARRFYKQGENLYGITKAVDHPRAPANSSVVRMDVFYSMWRSRNVPCPWSSGRPAVETLLLHHEQFKIPENLSRFAVRHGMWGFVKKMSQMVPCFVTARREKGVDPFSPDPDAFGSSFSPNPPLSRYVTSKSISSFSASSCSCSDNSDTGSECDSTYTVAAAAYGKRSFYKKLRSLATFAISSSVALLLHGKSTEESERVSKANKRAGICRSSSLPMLSGSICRQRGSGRFLAEI